MYYFLGIVEQKHLNEGIFQPDFIVGSDKQLRHIKDKINYKKGLFTRPYLDGYYIDKYSNMRQYVENRKIIQGAMFWYECNIYGDPIGNIIFIKQVPDMSYTGRAELRDSELDILLKNRKEKDESWITKLSKERYACDLPNSSYKPKLLQSDSERKWWKHDTK